MAASDPPQTQKGPTYGSILDQRLPCIARAVRMEPARARQQRGNKPRIEPHQGPEQTRHHRSSGPSDTARRARASNSWKGIIAARPSARITTSTPVPEVRAATRKASRRRRLTRFLCTAPEARTASPRRIPSAAGLVEILTPGNDDLQPSRRTLEKSMDRASDPSSCTRSGVTLRSGRDP